MEIRFNFSHSTTNFIQLLYLFITQIFISHFFACVWSLVGRLEMEYDNTVRVDTWLEKRGIAESSWVTQYLNAIYFSIVTMCTVGYGDITPSSNLEILLSTLNILIGTGVFAYNVNEVGQVFNDLKKQDKIS